MWMIAPPKKRNKGVRKASPRDVSVGEMQGGHLEENIQFMSPKAAEDWMKQSNSTLLSLHYFVRERVEIEHEYVRSMKKWVEKRQKYLTKQHQAFEYPELNRMVEVLVHEAALSKQRHDLFLESVTRPDGPIKGLDRLLEPQETGAKEAEDRLGEYEVTIEKHMHIIDNINRTKRRYHHASQKYEKLKSHLETRLSNPGSGAQGDRVVKSLQTKLTAAEVEVNSAKLKYESCLDKEHRAREQFCFDVGRYQDEMRGKEEERIHSITSDILSLMHCLQYLAQESDAGEILAKGCRDLQCVDLKLMLGQWEKAHLTNVDFPDYQEYDPEALSDSSASDPDSDTNDSIADKSLSSNISALASTMAKARVNVKLRANIRGNKGANVVNRGKKPVDPHDDFYQLYNDLGKVTEDESKEDKGKTSSDEQNLLIVGETPSETKGNTSFLSMFLDSAHDKNKTELNDNNNTHNASPVDYNPQDALPVRCKSRRGTEPDLSVDQSGQQQNEVRFAISPISDIEELEMKPEDEEEEDVFPEVPMLDVGSPEPMEPVEPDCYEESEESLEAMKKYWLSFKSQNSDHFINTKEWRSRTAPLKVKQAWSYDTQPRQYMEENTGHINSGWNDVTMVEQFSAMGGQERDEHHFEEPLGPRPVEGETVNTNKLQKGFSQLKESLRLKMGRKK